MTRRAMDVRSTMEAEQRRIVCFVAATLFYFPSPSAKYRPQLNIRSPNNSVKRTSASRYASFHSGRFPSLPPPPILSTHHRFIEPSQMNPLKKLRREDYL